MGSVRGMQGRGLRGAARQSFSVPWLQRIGQDPYFAHRRQRTSGGHPYCRIRGATWELFTDDLRAVLRMATRVHVQGDVALHRCCEIGSPQRRTALGVCQSYSVEVQEVPHAENSLYI